VGLDRWNGTIIRAVYADVYLNARHLMRIKQVAVSSDTPRQSRKGHSIESTSTADAATPVEIFEYPQMKQIAPTSGR